MNIAKGFDAAEAWDIEQQIRMTPLERMRAAAELKRRFYPPDAPDIRECPGTE